MNPNPRPGERIHIVIDRPLGSHHPKYPDHLYPVNYGYVPGIIGGDGQEQDAYILGVDKPLAEFDGILIAVLHREDDCEEKWVAAPEGVFFTVEEIMEAVRFQERYFKTSVREIFCPETGKTITRKRI